MKKVLVIFSILVGIFLLTIVVVPLVVDVNKYKPQIISAVEKNIQGKVELGNIKLSLLTGPGLQLSEFKLKEMGGENKTVFEVNILDLKVPWTRIFFAPVLNVKINEPQIYVEMDSRGELNLMKILRSSSTSTSSVPDSSGDTGTPPTDQAKSGEAGSGSATALPAIVKGAAINLALTGGTVNYKAKGEKYILKNFFLTMTNLSLSKQMTLKSSIDLAISSQNGKAKVEGPLVLDFAMIPELADSQFQSVDVSGKIHLSDLGIRYAPFIRKAKGAALVFDIKAKAQKDQISIQNLGLKTEKSSLSLNGAVNLVHEKGPQFDLNFAMKPLRLEEATQWVAGAGNASGSVTLESTIRGSAEAPRVAMNLHVDAKNIQPDGLEMAISSVATRMNLNFQGHKVGEVMKTDALNLEMPELNIRLEQNSMQGAMALKGNEEAMQLALKLKSDKFDFDKIMGPPKSATAAQGATDKNPQEASQSSAQKKAPEAAAAMPLPERLKLLNAQIQSFREIDIMKKSAGTLDIDFKQLKFSGLDFAKFKMKAGLNRLQLKLDELAIETFGGSIQSHGAVNMRQPRTDFSTTLQVKNIDLDSATKMAAPSMAGLISGRLFVDGKMDGQGILWPDLRSKLTGKGKMEIKNGRISTIPIGKWAMEALSQVKLLGQFSGKVQEAASKEYGDEIRELNAEMNVQGGVANLQPVTFEYSHGGIGFGGQGTVDFDQKLNFTGDAKFSGLNVNELKGKDGRTYIPLRFSGAMTAPKVDYGFTVKELTERMAKGQLKKVKNQAIQKVLEDPKVQQMIQKPEVQEGINKLFKGKKLF